MSILFLGPYFPINNTKYYVALVTLINVYKLPVIFVIKNYLKKKRVKICNLELFYYFDKIPEILCPLIIVSFSWGQKI